MTGVQTCALPILKKNEDGTYTITENGRYEFTATDSKGNTKTKEITVKKIDKLVPSKVEIMHQDNTDKKEQNYLNTVHN